MTVLWFSHTKYDQISLKGLNLNRNAVPVVRNLTGTAFRTVPGWMHSCLLQDSCPVSWQMGIDDGNNFDSDIIWCCILRVPRNNGDDASDVTGALYHLQSTHGWSTDSKLWSDDVVDWREAVLRRRAFRYSNERAQCHPVRSDLHSKRFLWNVQFQEISQWMRHVWLYGAAELFSSTRV